jgi:hypothetical protein
MLLFAQRLEFKHIAQNQSDRVETRLRCSRPDREDFEVDRNFVNVRAAAGAVVVASMMREEAQSIVVEEVRGVGMLGRGPTQRAKRTTSALPAGHETAGSRILSANPDALNR